MNKFDDITYFENNQMVSTVLLFTIYLLFIIMH